MANKASNLAKNNKIIEELTPVEKKIAKKSAMDLEVKNFNKLIFYQSDKGYHKLTGHSAMFYSGNIATRIGRRFNLRIDNDNYYKFLRFRFRFQKKI